MPIYEYRCENGHQFEVIQRMSDAPVMECVTCSEPVSKIFHPIAVHFKGSGFYNTDYGTRKRALETKESKESVGSKSSSENGSGSSADKSDSGSKPKPASSTSATTSTASKSSARSAD